MYLYIDGGIRRLYISGSIIVVTALDCGPGDPCSSPEWVPIMRLDRLHRAYIRAFIHSAGTPEHLNIKAVTEACKLIDSSSLKTCARPHKIMVP